MIRPWLVLYIIIAILLMYMAASREHNEEEEYFTLNYPAYTIGLEDGVARVITYVDSTTQFDTANGEPIVIQDVLKTTAKDKPTQQWVYGSYEDAAGTYNNIIFQDPQRNAFRCIALTPNNGRSCNDTNVTNLKAGQMNSCRVTVSSKPSECAAFVWSNGKYRFKDISQGDVPFCLREVPSDVSINGSITRVNRVSPGTC